ncbi:hypothetical protein EYC98_07700 [Halieaceae bacterium IMCC14734]|uniref:Dockerin domain-containing protein n=1 Tax=Candidatus Litorirhabdus singularis TaxID=2518993 RepID=A0ABT3TH95_9GAMM|nr:pentapeptide repeat-containing protein [Candidatus Litorirhabdus singularis]MCX2980762.1 hypothetical protein [Candidatus Litorirhabdus singularis]
MEAQLRYTDVCWATSRLLVAAACLAMLPSTAHAGTDYYNSDSVWKTAAEAEVGSWIQFQTVQTNIQEADQVAGIVGDNEQLGRTLGFDKNKTGLCQSVYLQTVESGAGFTFNDTEGSGLVFTPNALSVGDVNNHENDDFELQFNPAYGLPRAVGFYIVGNTAESGENIQVYGVGNTLLFTGGLPGYSAFGAFAGFVSTEGITKIRINESSAGGDDIALKDVWLGPNATSQSGDFDGLSDCDEVSVYGTDPTDNDTDNDNLLDGWEVQYGFDPIGTNESALDTDSDLLTNLQEQAAGTLPKNPDTDGDNLLDGWELQYGFDPIGTNESALNTDFDLLTHLQEQAAGTLPNNPDTDGDTLLDGAELANTALGYDPLTFNTLRAGDFNVNGNIVGPGADLSGADLSDADLAGLTEGTLNGVSGQLSAASGMTLPDGYIIRNNYIVGPGVDLTGANLTDTDLRGAFLTGAELSAAVLVNADLRGADMTNANLAGADLTGADLSEEDGPCCPPLLLFGVSGQLHSAVGLQLPDGYSVANNYIVGIGVDLTGADLTGAGADGVYFSLGDATLTGVSGRLSRDIFWNLDLPPEYHFINGYIAGPDVDLSGADLWGWELTNLDLSSATLIGLSAGELTGTTGLMLPAGYSVVNGYIVGPGVDLSFDLDGDRAPADLRDADLSSIDLTDADLRGALLIGADLTDALLLNVDLRGADMTNANLAGADLTGADLSEEDGPCCPPLLLFGVSGQLHSAVGLQLPDGYSVANNYIVGIGVDLTGADLTGAGADGVYFALSDATLTGVSGRLSRDIFWNLDLPPEYHFINGYIAGPDVDLSGADLWGWELTNVDLSSATLIGLSAGELTGTTGLMLPAGYSVVNGYIVGPGVDLSFDFDGNRGPADLRDADLRSIDLTDADLRRALLMDADLSDAILIRADLRGTVLANAKMAGADLTDADLSEDEDEDDYYFGPTLVGVSGQLKSALGVKLPYRYSIANNYIVGRGVDLTRADLAEEDLTGADLSNAILILADLTNAIGLDTTIGAATYFYTNFTGTGFDPVAAGWTLCAECTKLGDLAPRGNPDNLVNAGDLLLMTQMINGVIQPTAVETELGDIDGNGALDIADLLLMQQNLLNGAAP